MSLSVKDSTQQIFLIHTRPDSATAACERGNGLNAICHFHVSISVVCCVVFAVIRMANHAGSPAH